MEDKQKFGDQKFDVDQSLFVRKEVLEILGIKKEKEQDFDNLIQRSKIKIGTVRRLGRRMYSLADLCELKIVVDLVNYVSTPAGVAVGAANYALKTSVGLSVRKRLMEITKRDAEGKMLYKGIKNEPHLYLVLWFEGGNPKITIHSGTDWFIQSTWSHPFIFLDLDHVIFCTVNKAFDVLEEENAGQGEHDEGQEGEEILTIDDVRAIPTALIDDPENLKSSLAYQEFLEEKRKSDLAKLAEERRIAAEEKRRRNE